jgi:phosphatidylinositol 4-kinase type 2
VAEPPKPHGTTEFGENLVRLQPVNLSPNINPQRPESNTSRPYKRYEAMESRSGTPSNAHEQQCSVTLGAIDNSLSWPWKHPDAVSPPYVSIVASTHTF